MNFTLIIAATILTCGLIFFLFQLLDKKLNLLMEKMKQEQQQQPPPPPPVGGNPQLFAFKIQAYERILLYTERIELESLVMRTFLPDMTVQQLQGALLKAIREEFEHNTTQQLYVTELTWECVKAARTFISSVIAQAYKELSPSDSGIQLAQVLFAAIQDKETYTFDNFPLIIKREMAQDLS
ncbi:MAG: hypothetical protein FWF09_06465 [Bacteroidales bacterium]|nr:hypothetical protein [Bacteroidales bacterium]